MNWYLVKYYAGTYGGEKWFQADDEDHAIAKCKAWVRREMTISMYADGYKVIDSH